MSSRSLCMCGLAALAAGCAQTPQDGSASPGATATPEATAVAVEQRGALRRGSRWELVGAGTSEIGRRVLDWDLVDGGQTERSLRAEVTDVLSDGYELHFAVSEAGRRIDSQDWIVDRAGEVEQIRRIHPIKGYRYSMRLEYELPTFQYPLEAGRKFSQRVVNVAGVRRLIDGDDWWGAGDAQGQVEYLPEEEVEVPAGRYKATPVYVKTQSRGSPGTIEWTCYLVPGIFPCVLETGVITVDGEVRRTRWALVSYER